MHDPFSTQNMVFFAGDHAALLHRIATADSIYHDAHCFQCNFSFPKRFAFGFSRFRLSYCFRCQYKAVPGGYEIRYQVYPRFFACLLLLSVLLILAGTAKFAMLGEYPDAFGLLFFGCIPPVVYSTARSCCIRDFVQFFERKS